MGAAARLRRASVSLLLSLSPEAPASRAADGLQLALTGPLELGRGGGAGAGAGGARSFELTLTLGRGEGLRGARGAGSRLRLQISDNAPARPSVELDGRRLPGSAAAARALQRGLSEALAGPGLAEQAQSWIRAPRLAGSALVAGVPSERVAGTLVTARFSAEARRLVVLAASLARTLTGAPPEPALAGASQPAGGTVSLYIGAADHIPRELEVNAALAPRAAAGSHARYRLALKLRLSDVSSAPVS